MRDERGRFTPGQSGNPGGRPKGQSLTARLRARLQEAGADGEGQIADQIVERLVDAARDGEPAATKLLWNYAEGMPTATLEVEAEWIVPVLTPEELATKPLGWQRGPVIIDDV